MELYIDVKTIRQKIQHSFREKGSKFIGILCPTPTLSTFEEKLSNIKSSYPDATHHCYAWRLNPLKVEELAQDDGEPGGTAGLPILNQLKSYDIVNAACIVVRYYGGTKLGKSGLIQAYGKAAEICIEQSQLTTLIPTENFEIRYPYDQQSSIEQLKNRFNLKEIDAEYMEQITMKIACRREQASDFLTALQQLEHNGIRVEESGSSYLTMNS